jgi:hypothetical protein
VACFDPSISLSREKWPVCIAKSHENGKGRIKNHQSTLPGHFF